ncbi:MAG: sigma-70 family RNA polymerase sigma factor, partial [Gemmatimonadaceae bacterium]|nr:sigma-70 family RNA polymerase sigma factor [Chitinophagaceae bacterium]
RDLFQEIVLQLWRSFPAFRRESSGSTWIYRVALNTAISNFRKESRKPGTLALGMLEFQIPDMSSGGAGTENLLFLNQAIQELTEVERAVILLYLDEKSYDEIGEIIGISISNVGVRINRIKKKLQKHIKINSNEY